MLSQEIGRDAEQPGSSVVPPEVVGGPLAEGNDERARGQVFGQIGAHPRAQVPVDGYEVSIEDFPTARAHALRNE
jgi:hypothetical protein